MLYYDDYYDYKKINVNNHNAYNNSDYAHQSDRFDNDDNYNLAPSDLDHYQEDLEFENGGTRIEEDMDMNRYGSEGPEYEGYESEGLEYGRYKLEGFEHQGHKPRRTEFEGTPGGDIENIENESQRLRLEPDRETPGRYAHSASHIAMFDGDETDKHAMDYPDPILPSHTQ